MHIVAVYGTLKQGHGNHRRLEGSKFVGNAITKPEFTLLHLGGFPGIVREGNTAVHVELYEVTDDVLHNSLDPLEGHPRFYRRVPIEVTKEDGTVLQVEGYVLPSSYLQRGYKQLPGGIWPERPEQEESCES